MMCEEKEEVRGAAAAGGSPRRLCWPRPPPAPLPDTRGLCCAKLLRKNGKPKKVLLFPEEGWARSASSSYWTLQPCWWKRSRCKVVEVAGTRRCLRSRRKPFIMSAENVLLAINYLALARGRQFTNANELPRHTTHAKLVVSGGNAVYIVGTFKHLGSDADFKLYLTTNVTQADFNMGYTMTGTLERGQRSTNSFQVTHFAVLRRCDYDPHHFKCS